MRTYMLLFIASCLSTALFAQNNQKDKNQPTAQGAAPIFKAGSKVEIYWASSWYGGSVLEVKGDLYKVHYDGYSSSWDEWVNKNRLRAPGTNTATTAVKSSPVAPKEGKGTTSQPQTVVKQSYSGTAGKLYLRTFMRMIGTQNFFEINWIFLGADGTIVYDPKNGVDPINYKKEEQDNPNNIGKYQVAGKKMMVTWRNGRKEEWSIETKGGDFSAIDGGIVTRQGRLPANYRIAGQYAASAVLPNVASVRTFIFSKDGTFTYNTQGTISTTAVTSQKEWSQKGTYSISGNTLTLTFANGEIKKSVICIWDMGGSKNLVINGSYFPQEK